MNKNVLKDSWKYFRNYIDLAVSSNWQMAAFIPCFVVMALYLKLCWDVQSHKTNSSTSTVTLSPSKYLTDLHPDCSDSGMYQPLLIEEHDEIRYH